MTSRSEDSEQGMALQVPQALSGTPLLEFLSSMLINESKTSLRRLIGAGQVLLNGAAVPTGAPVRAGDAVTLPPGLRWGPPPAAAMDVDVLYEDEGHLCVSKPAGWPVLPGRKGQGAEFYQSLVALMNTDAPSGGPYRRPHVVHRLDRR